MSTLTVDLHGASIVDGKQLTFVAPCDCTGVTGLIIGEDTYALVDATGASIENCNQFTSGVMVSVIVSVTEKRAYIQNSIAVDVVPTSGSIRAVSSGGVADALDTKLDKTGGKLTGALTLAADPKENMQAATKQYVDTEIANSGGFVASDAEPDVDENRKTKILWINTNTESDYYNIIHYYDGSEWKPLGAVYG